MAEPSDEWVKVQASELPYAVQQEIIHTFPETDCLYCIDVKSKWFALKVEWEDAEDNLTIFEEELQEAVSAGQAIQKQLQEGVSISDYLVREANANTEIRRRLYVELLDKQKFMTEKRDLLIKQRFARHACSGWTMEIKS